MSAATPIPSAESIRVRSLYADAIEFGGTALTATAAELNALDGITATVAELNTLDGITTTVAELNTLDGATPVVVVERTFTETSGAGTYTGAVALPAGATIIDIIVHAVALWDNAGAVTMKVGDTDDDGFYTGVNLKATDLLAGESLSFAQSGGKAGAYNVGTNTHWTNRYSATSRTINGIITTASTGGSAGRTRMIVVYVMPVETAAATKA